MFAASSSGDLDARLKALLSVAYGRSIDTKSVGHLKAAAARWKPDDPARAEVHLALAKLGRLTNPDAAARRLFMADGLMKAGVSAGEILVAAGLAPASARSLLKYDPQQPRVPAGNGRASGEWTDGSAAPTAARRRPAVSRRRNAFKPPRSTSPSPPTSAPAPNGGATSDQPAQDLWLETMRQVTGDPQADYAERSSLGNGGASAADLLPISNPISLSVVRTRAAIAHIASQLVGAKDWEYDVSAEIPESNAVDGPQSYKCSLFVYDVLSRVGAGPGLPNGCLNWAGRRYPPTPSQWADPRYNIPGWRALGPRESPQPGDVVAQHIPYRDADGHVMIVGANNTFIGTGGGLEDIEQIPMRQTLAPAGVLGGPLVYRRWVGR